MANNSIALGVEVPDFGNSFAKGAAASQDRQINSMKMDMAQKEQGREEALQLMGMLGSAGMYALNGDMNGTPDPAKWDEAMDGLSQFGLDAAKYKGKPQLAPVLVNASISATDRIKMAKDDREFSLAMEKLDADLASKAESNDLRREGLEIQRQRLDTVKNKKTPLSATAQKELFEADESVQAGGSVIGALNQALELNKQAMYGLGAETRGKVGSWLGVDSAEATEKLKNIVTGQALENLKATFGGMPTEGERKILLEIQGSVDQAPDVRKDIYDRAIALAAKRIDFNKRKAEALRSGEYFSEGMSDDAASDAGTPAGTETGGGTQQVIDGVTYEQDENGDWFEVE